MRRKWSAFLELGFRPLYLAGCFWAAVSVALWVFAPGLLRGQLVGVIWHAHEMLWGFIATIAVGFLLTAGRNWTGINPLKGRALSALGLLWVLTRVGYLVLGAAAFGFPMMIRPGINLATTLALKPGKIPVRLRPPNDRSSSMHLTTMTDYALRLLMYVAKGKGAHVQFDRGRST